MTLGMTGLRPSPVNGEPMLIVKDTSSHNVYKSKIINKNLIYNRSQLHYNFKNL